MLDEAIDYNKYELTGPKRRGSRAKASAAVSTFYKRRKDCAEVEARRGHCPGAARLRPPITVWSMPCNVSRPAAARPGSAS
jgi:hypothetical protein